MSSNNKKSTKKPFRRFDRVAVKKTLEPPRLIVLTHGKDTNFPAWKEAMRNQVAMDYGSLVSIIDDGVIAYPAEIDPDEYNLDADPHGVNIHILKTDLTTRAKMIARITEDEPKVRALFWKYMSRESMEAVLRTTSRRLRHRH